MQWGFSRPLLPLMWPCHCGRRRVRGAACQCQSAPSHSLSPSLLSPPHHHHHPTLPLLPPIPAPGKCQVVFSAWVRWMSAAQPSLSAQYSTWSGSGQNSWQAGAARHERRRKKSPSETAATQATRPKKKPCPLLYCAAVPSWLFFFFSFLVLYLELSRECDVDIRFFSHI